MMGLVALLLIALLGAAQAFVAPISGMHCKNDVQMRMGAKVDESGPLKKVHLSTGKADVEVYTLGACVTSYKLNGHDALFVRPDAKLDGSKPISGGLPFCFPQFGPGAMQQHGFARNLEWEIAGTEGGDEPSVTLKLFESEETMLMWPFAFELTYKVTLAEEGTKLKTHFAVKNTGDSELEFQAALHSYFRCDNINDVEVKSSKVKGADFEDRMAKTRAKCEKDSIKITEETDSIYHGLSGDIVLEEKTAKRALTIANTAGWADTVVWNPYGNAGMGADNFICVESAKLKPVELGAGKTWVGEMTLTPSA